jgi:hypothetical protein
MYDRRGVRRSKVLSVCIGCDRAVESWVLGPGTRNRLDPRCVCGLTVKSWVRTRIPRGHKMWWTETLRRPTQIDRRRAERCRRRKAKKIRSEDWRSRSRRRLRPEPRLVRAFSGHGGQKHELARCSCTLSLTLLRLYLGHEELRFKMVSQKCFPGERCR